MTVHTGTHGRVCDAAGTELFRLDLTDGSLFATTDLRPVWRELRRSTPVAWQQLADGRGFWVVATHREGCAVLTDHDRFTSTYGSMLGTLGRRDPAGGRQMATSDPPYVNALRAPLRQVVNMTAARTWTPQIRTFIRNAVEQVCREGVWDVGAIMSELPMQVGALIMGVTPDAEERAALVRYTRMAVAPDDPDYTDPGGPAETLRAAHRGLFRYFTAELGRRQRRTSPGTDLIDQLLTLRVDDRRLSAGDVAVNCYNLLIGANTTTGFAVTGLIEHLTGEPALYDRWSADPTLLRSGVEEAIRWATPAMHVMRHARRDTELAGVRIAEGDAVTVWLSSANRDENVFRAPDTFDPARFPNPHIAFGFGTHYCLGAATARITMRAVVEEIFRLVGRFEPAGAAVRLHSSFIDGIKRLPVAPQPRR